MTDKIEPLDKDEIAFKYVSPCVGYELAASDPRSFAEKMVDKLNEVIVELNGTMGTVSEIIDMMEENDG